MWWKCKTDWDWLLLPLLLMLLLWTFFFFFCFCSHSVRFFSVCVFFCFQFFYCCFVSEIVIIAVIRSCWKAAKSIKPYYVLTFDDDDDVIFGCDGCVCMQWLTSAYSYACVPCALIELKFDRMKEDLTKNTHLHSIGEYFSLISLHFWIFACILFSVLIPHFFLFYNFSTKKKFLSLLN